MGNARNVKVEQIAASSRFGRRVTRIAPMGHEGTRYCRGESCIRPLSGFPHQPKRNSAQPQSMRYGCAGRPAKGGQEIVVWMEGAVISPTSREYQSRSAQLKALVGIDGVRSLFLASASTLWASSCQDTGELGRSSHIFSVASASPTGAIFRILMCGRYRLVRKETANRRTRSTDFRTTMAPRVADR